MVMPTIKFKMLQTRLEHACHYKGDAYLEQLLPDKTKVHLTDSQ